MTATHTEREQFVLTLARYRPQTENHHVQRLMRYASGYAKSRVLCLQHFNWRDMNKMKRIKTAIRKLCKEIECEPWFGETLCLLVDTGEFSKVLEVPRV